MSAVLIIESDQARAEQYKENLGTYKEFLEHDVDIVSTRRQGAICLQNDKVGRIEKVCISGALMDLDRARTELSASL